MRRVAKYAVGLGVVAMCAGMAGVGIAAGQQKDAGASDGWIKLPAAGDTMASAFVVVENPTMYDIYLMSGATEVAEKVEFREKAGGVEQALKMVTVAAFDSVSMNPNGIYLRLTGLKRPLKEGEAIPLTLTTSGSAVMQVSAVVRKE